jgi:glycosyltransferase involved in cell wall biosynthesis
MNELSRREERRALQPPVHPYLSIVVPLFNEEDNVRPLIGAVLEAGLPYDFELLLVDDGSRDATFARAQALVATFPFLRVVRLRRNYGQTAATTAGIDHARGRVIVVMDGDLQNDPGDIPRLVAKIEEGHDVVVGWRVRRQDAMIRRRIPSLVANRLLAWVTGVRVRDNGCSLKAYRAEFIKRIPLYSDMHRFIPAMTSLAGPALAEIPVRHHPRRFGTSKYGLTRIYKVAVDLLVVRNILTLASGYWPPFLAPAALAAAAGLAAFLAQTLWLPTATAVVMYGISVLTGALALFLVLLGLLVKLIERTGSLDLKGLSGLTTREVDLAAPPAAGGRA